MSQEIRDAIESKRLLSFQYKGQSRVVEPHRFGVSKKGSQSLSAYQVRGGSNSGDSTDWKIFNVAEMRLVVVLAEVFEGPRSGYSRFDDFFVRVLSQL